MAIRATVIDPTGNGAELVGPAAHAGIGTRVAGAILETIAAIPTSAEPASQTPSSRAAVLTKKAAQRAAGISGGAALVPGPLGMLSLLPDIIGVWKVQAQMVADIAATYGKTATLTTEQMLYCLFKHMSSHGLRDLVVRMGERFLVRRASLQLLQKLAAAIGIKMTQRATAKAIARYAPIVGAVGVGVYAFYDTKQVGMTAIDLFSRDVVLDSNEQDH